jgi:hypothetical protein
VAVTHCSSMSAVTRSVLRDMAFIIIIVIINLTANGVFTQCQWYYSQTTHK